MSTNQSLMELIKMPVGPIATKDVDLSQPQMLIIPDHPDQIHQNYQQYYP